MFHSVQYGRGGGKRNSSVCCFLEEDIESFGIIQKFVSCSNGANLALISPFKINSTSLLNRIGRSGRDVLEIFKEADLVSAFIIAVEKELQPLCAISVSKLLCKCVKISCDHLPIDFVVKIPNNYEHH